MHDCPVLCAGDIFDKWNSPPELINFAYDNLPDNMIAIPGQHDLPLHKYDDIEKSAYWTLINTGKIKNLTNQFQTGDLILYGFPYGFKVEQKDDIGGYGKEFIHIAVVHEYRWIPGHSYPNAPTERKIHKRMSGVKGKKWLGYDAAVFGDNHIGFSTSVGNTQVFNCGAFMRRKSDEIDYKPQIGLLLESGKVEPYFLDTSKDKYLEIQDDTNTKDALDMKSFIEELEKLGDTSLDFQEALKEYLEKNRIRKEVKEILLKSME